MDKNDIEPLWFGNNRNDETRAFTMLRGVVDAQNYYSGNNVCDYTGDDPQHVEECRQTLCKIVGIDRESLVMPRQTHSNMVAVIDDDFMLKRADKRAESLDGVDALVTTLRRVVIGVNTADCVPIMLRDVKNGVIGAAHAGWKGTVGRIADNVVGKMLGEGAQLSSIEAVIGASICAECFEVGDDVLERFADVGFPIEEISFRNEKTGKAHIDLWRANAWLLEKMGVPKENITLSGKCTRCNTERYFSARRLGINSGRTFTFIYLP